MKLGDPIRVRPWVVQSRDALNPEWKTVEHHPKTRNSLGFFLEARDAERAMTGLERYYEGIGRDDVRFRVVREP